MLSYYYRCLGLRNIAYKLYEYNQETSLSNEIVTFYSYKYNLKVIAATYVRYGDVLDW